MELLDALSALPVDINILTVSRFQVFHNYRITLHIFRKYKDNESVMLIVLLSFINSGKNNFRKLVLV